MRSPQKEDLILKTPGERVKMELDHILLSPRAYIRAEDPSRNWTSLHPLSRTKRTGESRPG